MKLEINELTYKCLKMLMKEMNYDNIDKCLQGAIAVNYWFISIIREKKSIKHTDK